MIKERSFVDLLAILLYVPMPFPIALFSNRQLVNFAA